MPDLLRSKSALSLGWNLNFEYLNKRIIRFSNYLEIVLNLAYLNYTSQMFHPPIFRGFMHY